jgi:hypothetical protein
MSWLASALTNAADPWSLLSRLDQHCPMMSRYPDDEQVCLLLVLVKLDNLLLYHGNVLLPDLYIPGADYGLHSLCLWVPWYLQSWKAQLFNCL